jgi:glycosyltransferase involved in cell wall biosynthesis
MDADGQHNPQDVLRLLARTPEYDLVVGARTQVFHSPIWRMPGKWLLNLFANYIAKTKIPDSNSGLRAFRTEIVKKYLHLFPDGFSFSATSTLVLIRRGYRVAFEPVSVTSRLGNSSMSIRSGLDLLLTVLRLSILIDPLRVFLPSSLIMAGTGVLWGTRYVLIGSGVSVGSLMFILMGVLMFGLGLLADQISEMRQERFE